MPRMTQIDHYHDFVQGGMKAGKFASGQFVLLGAGPPFLSDMAGGAAGVGGQKGDVVYPIGLVQNYAFGMNMALARVFEIGSERSYFIPGRVVGQFQLSRVWYDAASLLRLMYAYYSDQLGKVRIQPLFKSVIKSDLHDVKIPPGFENLFVNLASDMFKQPTGLFLLFRDSNQMNLGAVYLEQCYIPAYGLNTDSQGVIIQENCVVNFERVNPISINVETNTIAQNDLEEQENLANKLLPATI